MNVQRINSGFREQYPYQYYVDLATIDPKKRNEIISWTQDPGPGFAGAEFHGRHIGLGLYFKTEQEITLFMLRWA